MHDFKNVFEDKTRILITHHKDLIEYSDKVFLLENGVIKE